jgi:hypothetical protein
MKFLLIVPALLLVAAALLPTTNRTTQPSTKPSAVDVARKAIADRESDLQIAKQSVVTAQQACIDRVRTSDDYVAKKKIADELNVKLEQIRKTGTMQERLDASSAYGKVATELKAMEARALKDDEATKAAADAVAHAQIELNGAKDDLTRAQEQAKADAKAKIEADPIKSGIRDHKLVIGMTYDQAVEAKGEGGHKTHEDTESFTVEWITRAWRESATGPYCACSKVAATFADGKIESIDNLGSWIEDKRAPLIRAPK